MNATKKRMVALLMALCFVHAGMRAQEVIWHVKAMHPDGYILDVKAFDGEGGVYDVKALSTTGKLKDVKGIKMYDKRLELTFCGVQTHAHVVALPQIKD